MFALTAAVAAVPLAVAVAALRQPRWYPLLDHAQTELRVRDVGLRHPPLVGLPGRLWGHGTSGSHPGPLSFWALAPAYRLLGASSWALQAATAMLNVLAVGVSLAIARRRAAGARPGLVVGTAIALAVLVHAYGPETLTLAWNPFLPVLWWPAFLLAAWAVLDGDLPMLPVAAATGSFCTQTHLPYVGLVGVVGLATAGIVGVRARRSQGGGGDKESRGTPARPATARPGAARWVALAAGLLVVLWLPPIAEQLTDDPGNLSIVGETLRHPQEERVDAGDAARTWLVQLDPHRLVTGDHAVGGSVLPGLATVGAWAAAAGLAWRRRRNHDDADAGEALARLHVVVALALSSGLVATSRITGRLWDYLILWSWGTTALVLLATAWTAAVVAAPRLPFPAGRRQAAAPGKRGAPGTRAATPAAASPAAARAARVAAATALAALTVASTVEAARYPGPNPSASRATGELVTQTLAALGADGAPGGGRDGRYLVRWVDPVVPGAVGYALLLELERAGFDAALTEHHATGARPHRVMRPDDATATVTYVAGPALDRWRRDPAAVEIAATGPTAEDIGERERLRDRAADLLRGRGAPDLVRVLDLNLMAAAADPRTPQDAQGLIEQLADVPLPAAVFVTPPGHRRPRTP